MMTDVRLPGAAFPSALPEGKTHQFWLGITRNLVCLSGATKRVRASAALAIRGTGLTREMSQILAFAVDGFPSCVNFSPARQKSSVWWDHMHMNAEAALVSTAARQGTSLNGATIYCWPILSSCKDAALLVASGASVIVEPDCHIPFAQEGERQLISSMCGESGVLLVRETFDAIFGAHYDSPGEHLSDPSHASKSSPN